jgi:aminopeptidase-like protein
MRSKYHEYEEYHTSLDNLDFISPKGLQGAFEVLAKAISVLEYNPVPRAMLLCEPQLGKRGLYKNLAKKGSSASASLIKDFLSFSDGHHSLLDIAELVSRPAWELQTVCQELLNPGLIEDLAVH